MPETPQREPDDARTALATAFDADDDPLAAHAQSFTRLDVEPFELFLGEVLATQSPADSTRRKYARLFRQWRGYMDGQKRHPACPNETHVTGFVQYLQSERGNQPDTARTKLRRLNKVYRYWQRDPVFPHPSDYNPFELVLSKLDLQRPPVKQPPRIPLADLRAVLQSVTDIRDRTVLLTQLKLGLRASELCNIRLSDLQIDNRHLEAGYPQLGCHTTLTGRPNAVYVPSRYEREKNKSRRGRLLPIDMELQTLLTQWLLIRPDTGDECVFLTTTTHNPLGPEYVNRIWTQHFHPEYAETDQHRAVTSHYGRHRFTTYWQVEEPINRELVQYMRGDTVAGEYPQREGIDDYIHTYYEDIEPVYRERMFQLDFRPSWPRTSGQ